MAGARIIGGPAALRLYEPVGNTFDPSVTGLARPIGSTVMRKNATAAWLKTGTANTAWSPIGPSGMAALWLHLAEWGAQDNTLARTAGGANAVGWKLAVRRTVVCTGAKAYLLAAGGGATRGRLAVYNQASGVRLAFVDFDIPAAPGGNGFYTVTWSAPVTLTQITDLSSWSSGVYVFTLRQSDNFFTNFTTAAGAPTIVLNDGSLVGPYLQTVNTTAGAQTAPDDLSADALNQTNQNGAAPWNLPPIEPILSAVS